MDKLKKWFEGNFLDGDEIRDGQMMSSKSCFEAVKEAVAEGRKQLLEEVLKVCTQHMAQYRSNGDFDRMDTVVWTMHKIEQLETQKQGEREG